MIAALLRVKMRVAWFQVCALLGLLLLAPSVLAAARASIQPDRITLGNTATLTIETDQTNVTPDFSALEANFILRGQSSSVQTALTNGGYTAKTAYAIELEPRVEGVLTIPPIIIGNATTEALSLTVLPAQQGSAQSGDPIYIESEIGTTTPYVQQAVPYTVRLYYAVPLVGGDVTGPTVDGASLQQLGEDRQGQVEVEGRRYGVFERRYLLTPEKSGPLEVPPARFRGNAQTGGGNGFFSRTQNVTAVGKSFTLAVRPQPVDAPQPWLAARKLTLSRAELPTSARAGEPLMLELTLTADGATSAQLPDLQLPPIANAQVFPEPAQRQESIVNNEPVATLKRRFAIVPSQAGSLNLPAVKVGYWNIADDRADAAELSATSIQVAAGANNSVAPLPAAPIAPAASTIAADSGAVGVYESEIRFWQMLSLSLGVGVLLALIWGWRRGGNAPMGAAVPTKIVASAADPAQLRRALADGDIASIGDALRRSTSPPSLNLGGVIEQLADADQRDAVRSLQRLQWAKAAGSGQHAQVRGQLRSAFQGGPKWRGIPVAAVNSALPPLYPDRAA
ncbi:MAG TPA: BatD family protein [Xanthomonadales bacterium]|nr:BatD family protein [Xanthomonadales bacterium]